MVVGGENCSGRPPGHLENEMQEAVCLTPDQCLDGKNQVLAVGGRGKRVRGTCTCSGLPTSTVQVQASGPALLPLLVQCRKSTLK